MATTLIIRTRVLRTATTHPATLSMASSSVLDRGITGAILLGSGIVATMATPVTRATTGIAGLDADGTTTAMHMVVGVDTLTEAKCITTPAMDSMVENPSTAGAGSMVAAAFMAGA